MAPPHEVTPRVAPRRHSRLRLRTFRAFERAASWCAGRRFYKRFALAPGRFVLRDERIAVADLPPALEGFTIAHLSDLHGGAFMAAGDLEHVVTAVNARRPDLVVFTGDFITHAWSDALPLVEDCARLAVAQHGVYAVFGNHDYRGRAEGRIAEAYSQRGIRFLRDECVRIAVGDATLALAGLEDLEEARAVDVARARRDVQEGDVEVVLCHNPASARLLARRGCVAILAGHTHGMQMDLPYLRTLGPKHPGLRIEIGATAVIVSRGLGVVGFPLRVFAPAEVVMVTLERARGEST
jgi:predicted MPP superfamily phosphohydrolase